MYTLFGTAKLNDVAPQAQLADVLDRIDDLPQTQLHNKPLTQRGKAELQRDLGA